MEGNFPDGVLRVGRQTRFRDHHYPRMEARNFLSFLDFEIFPFDLFDIHFHTSIFIFFFNDHSDGSFNEINVNVYK